MYCPEDKKDRKTSSVYRIKYPSEICQDRSEKVIKENLENTINKARELNADFIGVTDDGNMGSKSFKINADVKIVGTGVIK